MMWGCHEGFRLPYPPPGSGRELAERVEGTTESVVDEIAALSDKERAEFYDLVFICECCDWWCSTDELNNEDRDLCDECTEEEGLNHGD